jgi:hypothetical protein
MIEVILVVGDPERGLREEGQGARTRREGTSTSAGTWKCTRRVDAYGERVRNRARGVAIILWVAGDEELRVTAEFVEVLAGA